jgi:hypothetical protein
LTIQGLGAGQLTVSGDSLSRVFDVQAGATVSLSGLTITGGYVAGTYNLGGLGGGIYNAGTLTVSGCTLTGNHADYEGGAIWTCGVMTVTDCILTGNTAGVAAGAGGAAAYGGAIFNTDLSGAGFLTVTSCKITGNTAASFGGGIYNENHAHLTLKQSVVTGNVEADLALSVSGYAKLANDEVGTVLRIG